MPSEPLGLLLLSGSHDRAHYAFVLASGAAALGRSVVLFATNRGSLGLALDWSGRAMSMMLRHLLQRLCPRMPDVAKTLSYRRKKFSP